MPTIRIDRRSVAALPVPEGRPQIYSDDKLKGFGVRVTPAGMKTYIFTYRAGHGGRNAPQRQYKLGRDSDSYRADKAREDALKVDAQVRLGEDPAGERESVRKADTVNDLLTAYLENHIHAIKKPKTYETMEGQARNYIRPALGTRSVLTITRQDIARLHRDIGKRMHPTKGKPLHSTANSVVVLLRAAFQYGVRQGFIAKGTENPATDIGLFKERRRERYLTPEELAHLGETLRLAETDGLPWEPDPTKKVKHAPKVDNRRVKLDPFAVAALRLLLFTGARLREILHLKWEYYDASRGLLILPDSKTGQKTIVLGAPAMDVLNGLPKVGAYVLPGANGLPRADLKKPWARVQAHAKLEGVRLHDLRHSFASVGAGAGLGLPIIGKLLGHAHAATTARYAHLDADPLRRATDAISNTIAAALAGSAGGNVVPIRKENAA